jgi:hypothetical protein
MITAAAARAKEQDDAKAFLTFVNSVSRAMTGHEWHEIKCEHCRRVILQTVETAYIERGN